MRILRNLFSIRNNNSDEEGARLFNKHIWPFYMEDGWEFVDDINNAEVVTSLFNFNPINIDMLKRLKPRQILLILSIFHIDETYEKEFYLKVLEEYRKVFPNCFIVHKNKAIQDVEGLIYYDCMFNRHKLYYHDYHKIESLVNSFPIGNKDIIWTAGATKEMFNIPQEKANPQNCRVFLSPGLLYQGMFLPRMRYRAGLKDFLRLHYDDKGYINSAGNNFLPNNASEGIERNIQRPDGAGGYWYPIGDRYYKETYISIYVETLTVSDFNTRCVTEKTFDPLIKGNFILPFAYSGFIKDVKSYGFRFPDFIDYSYDDIKDNDKRFFAYMRTIDMMFRINHNFRQTYEDNLHIIKHNRKVFIDRPYDNLYNKVKEQLSKIPVPNTASAL